VRGWWWAEKVVEFLEKLWYLATSISLKQFICFIQSILLPVAWYGLFKVHSIDFQ